jgi:hypothetical protein
VRMSSKSLIQREDERRAVRLREEKFKWEPWSMFPECGPRWRYTHTHKHLVPVLSTPPIDYYFDGGIVRAT